ncbi:hypothetical protein [Kitasatospora sp. NPDC054795]
MQLELQGGDATTFAAMRTTGHRAQTVDRATNGRPERSVRYRELIRPCGYGDELRINFDLDGGRWGSAAFMRERARGRYDLPNLRLAERIAAPIGAALRVTKPTRPDNPSEARTAGTAHVGSDERPPPRRCRR